MIDKEEKEMAAYQAGPFDDVKLQGALTIIAVYAAQMDYENCEADVIRIEAILERHPMFVARKKEIFSLINKYVNAMKANDPEKALEAAADALTREQKNIGFELAVEVALPEKDLTEDKKKMFDTLKAQLSISDEFAAQALGQMT
ncbi:MAG: hypothetical protein JSW26_02545 [Desulfobacterales bacterium]|nr:MAG: hypothetical protein JSW26_02545 [Desulfobacterales bacterium]